MKKSRFSESPIVAILKDTDAGMTVAPGRRHAVRTRYRYLSRDGAFVVEPVWANVRRRDQEAARSSSLVFAVALASGRGVRVDQR